MSPSPDTRMVKSPLGDKKLDSSGSAVGAARMDPSHTFKRISELLQDYINNGHESAWREIASITDSVYAAVGAALHALENAAPFSPELKKQVGAGKKLLFKVNLVTLPHIDYQTHGLGIPGAATEWAFTAAVMRWFHDALDITYHQMLVAEAGITTGDGAEMMTALTGRRVTREAIMEGKFSGGYGGWGFYFARKYLAEHHDPAHSDNPMQGYQESLDGHCMPPGTASDKLLIYDINIIDDKNGREVPVAGGEIFKTITMHKTVVGGNPADPQDMRDWPGCVLVNLPKLKVHVLENFTCAVKNLGMGLYPVNVNSSKEPGKYNWKYSAPNLSVPNFKLKIPHGRWQLETDEDTLMPVRNKKGELIWKKTGGMQAAMADTLQAVKGQGVMMLHVADAIEAVNFHNASPEGRTFPEGFVFAGRDAVALDECAARYLFTMAPMAQAAEIRRKYKINSDVIQKVPLPVLDGKNIATGEGYDSSFSRYSALDYCQKRKLGRRRFYVVGEDFWQGGSLASLDGRLGRVADGVFHELLTSTLYYAPAKALVDLQATVFAYLELNDELTGSHYKQRILDLRDENRDGIIDYLEGGKGTSSLMLALQTSLARQKLEPAVMAELRFLVGMVQAKLSRMNINPQGHTLGEGFTLAQAASTAFAMSRAREEKPDPLYPGRVWGKGKWPSLQYVLRGMEYGRVYGSAFPGKIDVFGSSYGQAFYYADMKYNGAKYCTPDALKNKEDVIGKYFQDIDRGTAPLPFTVYVPESLASFEGKRLPNVAATDDPALLFTAAFNGGKEAWRELHLSEYNLT